MSVCCHQKTYLCKKLYKNYHFHHPTLVRAQSNLVYYKTAILINFALVCNNSEFSKDRSGITTAQRKLCNFQEKKQIVYNEMMTRHLQNRREVVIEIEENDVNILSGREKAHLIIVSLLARYQAKRNFKFKLMLDYE